MMANALSSLRVWIPGKDVMANVGWMVSDKIVRMGVGLFVGLWVARYLGPERFGSLNYAFAFAGLFGAIANLGLDSIVVKDVLADPQAKDEILGTALAMKTLAGIVAAIVCNAAFFLFGGSNKSAGILVVICSSMLAFQAANVFELFFQSRMKSRNSVLSLNCATIIISGLKIILINLGESTIAFAMLGSAEVILYGIFLMFAYAKSGENLKKLCFRSSRAWMLIRRSWPLILSGLSVMLCVRMDQIMIGHFMTARDVGLFSAAVKISEIWYFVPFAISGSVFPKIMAAHSRDSGAYSRLFEKFMVIMLWIGLIAAIAVSFGGGRLVRVMYGDAYASASTVLVLHIWTGVFVCIGEASRNWYVIEEMQFSLFLRAAFGALVNLILNPILIYYKGIDGAAIATVVSQCCSAFLFDAIGRSTRPLFAMKLKAIFFKGILW